MEGSSGSYEYLVFFSTFVALAGHYGLEPVTDFQMPRLDALLDPVRPALPLWVLVSELLHKASRGAHAC